MLRCHIELCAQVQVEKHPHTLIIADSVCVTTRGAALGANQHIRKGTVLAARCTSPCALYRVAPPCGARNRHIRVYSCLSVLCACPVLTRIPISKFIVTRLGWFRKGIQSCN